MRGVSPSVWAARLRREKQRIVDQWGPWTTPVDLGHGVVSSDAPDPTGGTRLHRVVQIVEDVAGRPLDGVRILDLACLEGMVSVALALRGANVLGIETRDANLARARFARDVLELGNLDFAKDDVRNLSRQRYGSFEIVLCLGILYHLPAPDVFEFAERVFEVTEHFAVLDTHVAIAEATRKLLGPAIEQEHRGFVYQGREYREFDPATSEAERLKWAWSTVDARPSFWPTKTSLLTLLERCGFTSLMEVHAPVWQGMPDDRVTVVAMRGFVSTPRKTVRGDSR